jgi:hypothetical protein
MNISMEHADAIAELKQLKAEAEATALRATEEKDALLKRLEALEKPSPPTLARLSETAYCQCNRTVIYTESELPQLLSVPDATMKHHLAQIQANLVAWSQAGQVPVTFEQLLAGTPSDQWDGAYNALQQATGEAIWTRFYGSDAADYHHYVPFQLGAILMASLAKAGAKLEELENGEKLKNQAEKQFRSLQKKDEAAKKARTGPYGQ